MRQCPTPEGETTPLITHRIGIEVCFQRQRTHYHKCHRCVYRGKPADFQVPQAARLTPHVQPEPAWRNGAVGILQPSAPGEPEASAPAPEAGSGASGRTGAGKAGKGRKRARPAEGRRRAAKTRKTAAAGRTPGGA